ncbi:MULTISPECIES: DUF3165 family protein [unclassified Streptococcus]|uniref:DUF3165 family protein n=1 Tax=unclassified Streptococcus TaxID=2608887 RepID=UPI0011B6C33E|nr:MULTISPECIES: DUF3165 family protein [unclassified Streptococcus]TWS95428.1 DUF3165 family protein [Streptococcus sp. sy018]TWT12183.1 DUF3165 family protein [Streptococcus sp. sy004]TWT16553.1 DUF3165 family protein [Streptococcus sp. sy010]
MFYLIIALMILGYYFFAAPKSIKNTLNIIFIVGLVGSFVVLAILSFTQLSQSPPEIFVGLLMTLVGVLALKDMFALTTKSNQSKK